MSEPTQEQLYQAARLKAATEVLMHEHIGKEFDKSYLMQIAMTILHAVDAAKVEDIKS